MKKLATLTLTIILALTMVFILTACGGNDAAPATTTPTTTPEATPNPTPEQTPEPEPKPDEVEEDNARRIRGNMASRVYSSDFLGFQISFPNNDIGWVSENRIYREEDNWYNRYISEEIFNVIVNGEIPDEYWDIHTSFIEARAFGIMMDHAVTFSFIDIEFLSLDSLNITFEEYVKSEDAKLIPSVYFEGGIIAELILLDEKRQIGNFNWYELSNHNAEDIITQHIRTDTGETGRWNELVTRFLAEDVNNNLILSIVIRSFTGSGFESASASENEILAWFTPYP